MEIVEFLRARFDEDEDEASEMIGSAPPGHGKWPNDSHLGSPYWMLSEVEAKRRIVDHMEHGCCEFPYSSDLVLACLALPYAGHPDYREEWKP